MTENKEVLAENKEDTVAATETVQEQKASMDFKFFKCCSATLKRLSLLTFIMNVFLIIVATAIGLVLIPVYIGADMLSLLLLPVATVVIIAIVVARLISALIYGFAEIVEKHENK